MNIDDCQSSLRQRIILYPLMVKEKTQINMPVETGRPPLSRQTGKNALKYKKIAELASRGWTAEMISKEVGLKKTRIFRILKRDDVCQYVLEIVNEKFKEGDKILGWLYAKAMRRLDENLDSPIPSVRENAIEKVLKCYGYNQGEGKVPSIIQQIFTQGGPGIVQSIDDLIIQKRLERGLSIDVEFETKPQQETFRIPKTNDKSIVHREEEDDEEVAKLAK